MQVTLQNGRVEKLQDSQYSVPHGEPTPTYNYTGKCWGRGDGGLCSERVGVHFSKSVEIGGYVFSDVGYIYIYYTMRVLN